MSEGVLSLGHLRPGNWPSGDKDLSWILAHDRVLYCAMLRLLLHEEDWDRLHWALSSNTVLVTSAQLLVL